MFLPRRNKPNATDVTNTASDTIPTMAVIPQTYPSHEGAGASGWRTTYLMQKANTPIQHGRSAPDTVSTLLRLQVFGEDIMDADCRLTVK